MAMAIHGAVQILTHYPGLVPPLGLAEANSVRLLGVEEPSAASAATTATSTVLSACLSTSYS